jgi:hypothetical protein
MAPTRFAAFKYQPYLDYSMTKNLPLYPQPQTPLTREYACIIAMCFTRDARKQRKKKKC